MGKGGMEKGDYPLGTGVAEMKRGEREGDRQIDIERKRERWEVGRL